MADSLKDLLDVLVEAEIVRRKCGRAIVAAAKRSSENKEFQQPPLKKAFIVASNDFQLALRAAKLFFENQSVDQKIAQEYLTALEQAQQAYEKFFPNIDTLDFDPQETARLIFE